MIPCPFRFTLKKSRCISFITMFLFCKQQQRQIAASYRATINRFKVSMQTFTRHGAKIQCADVTILSFMNAFQ